MMFNVKTNTDAAVLLSPCDDFCNGYEILIGGLENTVSVIRDREGNRFTDSQVVNLHIRLDIGASAQTKVIQKYSHSH